MKTDKEKLKLSNNLISMLLAVDDTMAEKLCEHVNCETINCGDCPFHDQANMVAALQYVEVKNVA